VPGILCLSDSRAQDSFRYEQWKYPRVSKAFMEKEDLLRWTFISKGLPYPPGRIFIRVFKDEKILELWALSRRDRRYHFVKKFPICRMSGEPGPKRMELDMQAPEGFYFIDHFNSSSSYFLSLGINYPNLSDRILGDPQYPGSGIYIHGGCFSIGCFAITDEFIKELYVVAVEARSNGQIRIPVHIFPRKLHGRGMKKLKNMYPDDPDLILFWENLKPCYDHFEKTRRLPIIKVDEKGRYTYFTTESTEETE
jgi:murein L,D-transpeptidase YafK